MTPLAVASATIVAHLTPGSGCHPHHHPSLLRNLAGSETRRTALRRIANLSAFGLGTSSTRTRPRLPKSISINPYVTRPQLSARIATPTNNFAGVDLLRRPFKKAPDRGRRQARGFDVDQLLHPATHYDFAGVGNRQELLHGPLCCAISEGCPWRKRP